MRISDWSSDVCSSDLILRRVSQTEVRSLAALYRFLDPGELPERMPEHAVFRNFWSAARSDSFVAPDRVLAMREVKNRSRIRLSGSRGPSPDARATNRGRPPEPSRRRAAYPYPRSIAPCRGPGRRHAAPLG